MQTYSTFTIYILHFTKYCINQLWARGRIQFVSGILGKDERNKMKVFSQCTRPRIRQHLTVLLFHIILLWQARFDCSIWFLMNDFVTKQKNHISAIFTLWKHPNCSITEYFLMTKNCPYIVFSSQQMKWIYGLLSIWWKCPFALSKMPSYIPWQNALF